MPFGLFSSSNEYMHQIYNSEICEMVPLLDCFSTLQNWAKKCPIPQTDNAEIHGPLFKKGLPLESFVFHFVKVTRSDKWFTNTQLWVIANLNINSIWVSIDRISFFSISISDCLNKIDMWQSPWSEWSSTAAEEDYQINTICSWQLSHFPLPLQWGLFFQPRVIRHSPTISSSDVISLGKLSSGMDLKHFPTIAMLTIFARGGAVLFSHLKCWSAIKFTQTDKKAPVL